MVWSLFPTKRPTISKTTVDLMILFGLMVLFYGQPFLNPGRTSYGGDGFSLFLPALDHYRQTVYHGMIPFWNPYTWLGSPFLAAYQAAVLYPPQLLSLIFDTSAAALNFGIFLSLLWLAYGSYIFGVRALELERFPSLLMGIAMGCCGFVGAHADHVNQLAAISWIPWIMCEALILLRWARVRNLVTLALCQGMQVLAGHPQYVVYTLVYLAALAATYFVYYYHRRRLEDGPPWRGIVLLAMGVLAGWALGAAQILPSMELSSLSVRQFDPPERMLDFSFPPLHLLTLVLPQVFGNAATGLHSLGGNPEYAYSVSEFTVYLGLVTMCLALVAILTMMREFVVRCFLILALLSLLISFGRYAADGLFYRVAVAWLPGAAHLRAPSRFLIFFNLSLVVLAAMGFNQVVFYLKERRRITATTLAPLRFLILVVVFADLFLFSLGQVFRYSGPVDILNEKGPALKLLGVGMGDYRVFQLLNEVPYQIDVNRIEENYSRKKTATRLQIQRFQPNLNILPRISVCEGYEEGLLPTLLHRTFIGQDSAKRQMGRFHRNLWGEHPDTILLGLMNVQYLITDKPVSGDRLKPLFRYSLEGDPDVDAPLQYQAVPPNVWPTDWAKMLSFYALYENLDYCPKIMWGEELRKRFDLDALYANPLRGDAMISMDIKEPNLAYRRDPKMTSIPHSDLWEKAPAVRSRQGEPNLWEVTKAEGDSGELIMVESYYPGWVCRYEKSSAPFRRVNSFMMACDAPAGVKDLRFVYEPFSFRLGLFISCLMVSVLSIALLLPDSAKRPQEG